MFAYMNAEALALTIETGEAHFWAGREGKLWKKGEDSGNVLRVVELRTDCDQDAMWLKVDDWRRRGRLPHRASGPASIAPSRWAPRPSGAHCRCASSTPSDSSTQRPFTVTAGAAKRTLKSSE